MVVNSMGMPTLHDGPREASLLMVMDGKMDGESGLCLLDEHHGVGADALFSAGEAQSLGGGGLDGDIVLVDAIRSMVLASSILLSTLSVSAEVSGK